MSRLRGLTHRFEFLLDWGNDLTSVWGPFRRWLPPKDVKVSPLFAVLWTGFYVISIIVGGLAAMTVIEMILGPTVWYPTVKSGRSSLLFVVSYCATWLTHRYGFLIFCLGPALILMVNALTIEAWNLRSRRLQKEGPPQESEKATSSGVWPPPPANRK